VKSSSLNLKERWSQQAARFAAAETFASKGRRLSRRKPKASVYVHQGAIAVAQRRWKFDPARYGAFWVACLAFLVLVCVSHVTPSVEFNYALQADAWLHGRLAVDRPGPWIDTIPWRGGWYTVEAPFPALFMLPLAAISGIHANQTLLAVVLGAAAVGAAWELCRRLGAPLASRVALTAFFAFGTDLFWCSIVGDVWFVAHVSAVLFTLLVFIELNGKRRGWLVALFAAAAALSRYSLLPALAVYPFLLDAPNRRRALLTYLAAIIPVLGIWVWYNEIRWGTPNDVGFQLFHQLYYLRDHPGAGPMLDVANVKGQLWNFFVKPPLYFPRPPWVGADQFGLALTYTSPALVAAFLARRPRPLVVACWLLAIAAAIPSLLYYDGGGVQFGIRHALDFEPFLFVLMVLGAGKKMPPWVLALIAWSVLVGIWGVWFWYAYPPGHSP